MQRFEYKILEVPAARNWWTGGVKVDFQVLSNKLNELGREGWEVTGSTDLNRYYGGTANIMIILKRQLNNH